MCPLALHPACSTEAEEDPGKLVMYSEESGYIGDASEHVTMLTALLQLLEV